MKATLLLLGLAAVLSGVAATRACGITPDIYAQQALSTNTAIASNAVARLRQSGSAGLNALLKLHEPLATPFNKEDPQLLRLRSAIDAVVGQRDCYASRLFWHKDFDAAKAEAQRSGKPILSLRLLGNLDEELSCANSRFFRTTLYANKEVSDYLRDHFVLHWRSVRPVPCITIDMGDGRKIKRTITGNSIHYVLDAKGDVLDALPGLYGPRAFLEKLRWAESLSARMRFQPTAGHTSYLAEAHLQELRVLTQRWEHDLATVKATGAPVSRPIAQVVSSPAPTAAAAMPLTVTKRIAELPMLRSLSPRRAELERSTDDELWAKIARLHEVDGMLDAHSVELIRAKTMNAKEAMRLALSKSRVEDPLLKTMQHLQRSIAEDTVRNEYTFHARIHEWLATANASREIEALNRRVYAELFLTPDSDPWLGLVPADTFSAIENGGLVQNGAGEPTRPTLRTK